MTKSRFCACCLVCAIFILDSCKKENIILPRQQQSVYNDVVSSTIIPLLSEDFEAGSKTNYTAANILLGSGSWRFTNAVTGSAAADHKTGLKAARLRSSGSIVMNFDLAGGISVLTIAHAKFGKDSASTWELRTSTNGGVTWTKNGSTINTISATLQTETFYINEPGAVRIAVVKTSGAATTRLNIDNIIAYPYQLSSMPDNDHLLMGNPSSAMPDTQFAENYLMAKTYYDLSYSRSRGIPNWVCWHLQAGDIGSVPRQNDYRADNLLPASWYHVQQDSYSGSGFDRGHNCPSGDRTSTIEANSSTFVMTNMIPQAPNNNQVTWEGLEDSCRTFTSKGNELYIIMGSYGAGGTGSNGTFTTINNGHVTVPSNIWKVVVILPQGNNDLNRITTNTRIIAINTPNANGISGNWKNFRTSVDAIEAATGYDILSNLPPPVETVLETKVDSL